MKIDPKNLIIFVLTVACIILGVLLYNSKKPIDTSSEIAKMRLDSLAQENIALKMEINFQTKEKVRFKDKMDSLATLPPKIKETHTNEVKAIDTKNTRELISSFNKLFADNNIR